MNYYDYLMIKLPINLNTKIKLIEEYKTCEQACKQIILNGSLKHLNINEYDKIIHTNNSLKDKFDMNEYLNVLQKNNISIVKYGDDDYPEKLNNIENKPFAIFYKGNINLLKEYCISIIGTRNSTPYGEESCKNIAKELSVNGIPIVSGGARGIDILSHKICMENNNSPICILGSGLLNIYPKENGKYFNQISEQGCLISEYDLYTPPDKFNFPMRNRIISALGDGLIVVEAKEKSGTMITVKYALDQGKDIAAVPGPIFWEKSTGCNKLIRDGASIICEVKDLYDIFKLNNISKKSEIMNKRYSTLLSDPKKYSVFTLIKRKPISIDELVNITNIELVELYKILFELENLKIIQPMDGNFYQVSVG